MSTYGIYCTNRAESAAPLAAHEGCTLKVIDQPIIPIRLARKLGRGLISGWHPSWPHQPNCEVVQERIVQGEGQELRQFRHLVKAQFLIGQWSMSALLSPPHVQPRSVSNPPTVTHTYITTFEI
jgi:hypothetical protein